MIKVGLGYLTLNRVTSTLSGGEFQRIKLATSLGSALVGSMYIMDEPSIGLHPRDTARMVEVLKSLRDLGNTVIVVEHEEEIMRAADQIIDIGPDAGSHGGELIFQGTQKDLLPGKLFNGKVISHTTDYLTGKEKIGIPGLRRKWKDSITISGARENNLKNLTVKFPLGILTVYQPILQDDVPTHVRTPDGAILEIYSEELRQELSQRFGKEVELLQIDRGIFDEASVSVISARTIRGLARTLEMEMDQLL